MYQNLNNEILRYNENILERLGNDLVTMNGRLMETGNKISFSEPVLSKLQGTSNQIKMIDTLRKEILDNSYVTMAYLVYKDDNTCYSSQGKYEKNTMLDKQLRIPAEERDASDLYFRKLLTVDDGINSADFCAAAIDTFEVFINGTKVFREESNGRPVNFSLKPYLKPGINLIGIHVINHNPLNDVNVCSAENLPEDRLISLLLQGTVKTAGPNISVISDHTWIVNDICEEGWNQAEWDMESKAVDFDVQKIKNFNLETAVHEWIPAWERGKPPIKPWGDLPLFGNTVTYPVKLYYTVTIPAGTCRIYKPAVSGPARFFLDGKEIIWTRSVKELERNKQIHILTIQVTAREGKDGLQQPVRIAMKPFRTNLTDWRQFGMPWFSGRCMYTNTFRACLKGRRYKLDLGKVNFYAEIWINRKLAAVKIWPPYRIDITDFLENGENEITVVAANSAGNARRHMLVDEGMALGWNRYWNEDNMDRDGQNYVAGLLGPAKLISEKQE